MNLNKVILVGRLTQDPQSKILPSGSKVVSFGLATSRFFVDKEGQKKQETEFHNIVLFGKLAEIASQYLQKGALMLVEGRMRTRKWQDQNGNQHQRTEIIGERVQLGPKVVKKTPSLTEVSDEEIPVIEADKEIDISQIPF